MASDLQDEETEPARRQEALKYFLSASALDPSAHEIWLEIGRLAGLGRDWTTSRKALER
jgi:hypothetical protein